MLTHLSYKPQIWKKQTEDWLRRGNQIWAVAALDMGNQESLLYEEFDTWEQALACALSMNCWRF